MDEQQEDKNIVCLDLFKGLKASESIQDGRAILP